MAALFLSTVNDCLRRSRTCQSWRIRAWMGIAATLLGAMNCARIQAQTRGLAAETPQVAELPNGSYFALVIGIDQYPAPIPSLKTAVEDANAVAALLKDGYGFQVSMLLNKDATRDNILNAIAHFRKSLSENDNLLIYYAGHGSFDRETEKGYWLPVDADPDPLVTSRNVSADDLTTEVRGLSARHVLIVSDSCFSGDLSRDATTVSPSEGNEAFIRRMLRAPSRTLLASGSDEPVTDLGSGGHSVFASLLLQAMQSRSESNFTAADIYESIRKSVLARSGQSPQYAPLRNSVRNAASFDNGDFVFIRKGTAIPAANLVTASATASGSGAPDLPRSSLPTTGSQFARGKALFESGKYSEAFPDLMVACNTGSPTACSYLGSIYEEGDGKAKDLAQAASFFKRACSQGDARGCQRLGRMMFYGNGVDRDPNQAMTLFRTSCSAGYDLACTNLGTAYAFGVGVDKDVAQAIALLRKSCDNKEPLGCTNLGLMYENGNGVEKDMAQATMLYRKGCDGGSAQGCANLGAAYQSGNGVTQDPKEAVTLDRKACDGGIAIGCANLAMLYAVGSGVTQDFSQAAALARKACDGGYPIACRNLGLLYENGKGVPADKTLAAQYYRKACDAGEQRGCTALSHLSP